MSVLTEKQIKYGFNYYHNDDSHPKSVVTVSEYAGEKELVINCTQLEDTYSPRDKKRILREWCEFLLENPDAFSKLVFCTRMPQELFDEFLIYSGVHKIGAMTLGVRSATV